MPFEDWSNELITYFSNSDLPKGSKVYLFGSRARDSAHKASDIDIAILSPSTINTSHYLEEIDSLNIPVEVDLLNFDELSTSFKEGILKEGRLLFERT